MSERNGPGGIKTESRSPIITSGVATPKHASNNIMAVMAIAATKPASKPVESVFVQLIDCQSYCSGEMEHRLLVGAPSRTCTPLNCKQRTECPLGAQATSLCSA